MSDSTRPSRFGGLKALRKTPEPEPPVMLPDQRTAEAVEEGINQLVRRPKRKPAAKPTEGKRDNPEFTQVSAYVRESTHRAVKIAMLQRASDGDFSDLVEALLQAWVAGQVKV